MVRVNFIITDGARVVANGNPGDNLLQMAQGAGMPLEGTCEGQMACSTCHVVIGPEWFDLLAPATADEEDMLDLAAGVGRTSRLSCQIDLTDSLDGIEVHIPGEARDMQMR